MAAERKRVLIVEDDEDTRECLFDLFLMLGHEAAAAANGREALHRFTELKPDIVFIDIGLPDMSGHDLAPVMRRLAGTRPLRLVALTGWAQPRFVNASVDAGIDLHVVKPIGYTALRGIVGDATGGGDAHADGSVN